MTERLSTAQHSTEDSSQKISLRVLWGLFQSGKRGVRMCRNVCWKQTPKTHLVEHQMITANLTHTHTHKLKLMILKLSYISEDARIWAYWNYSFDMHLNYLGPVFLFFFILNSPSGAALGWLDWCGWPSWFTEMADNIVFIHKIFEHLCHIFSWLFTDSF